jgi:hypothetical protein
MNDLVASSSGGKPISEWYQDIVLIGPIGREAEAIQSHDVFGGIAAGVGGAADVITTLVDPIAALGSSVAGFLLDYLPPLVQMMDALAGNPEAVSAIAKTWSNISHQVSLGKSELDRATSQATQGWVGPAADAYRGMEHAFGELLDSIASACSAVSTGFEVASGIVKLVHEIVRQLIADLVGQLISAAVEEIATVGIGTPGVIAQAITKIAKYAIKARTWMKELTEGINGLLKSLNRINEIVVVAAPKLESALKDIHFVTIGGGLDALHQAISRPSAATP